MKALTQSSTRRSTPPFHTLLLFSIGIAAPFLPVPAARGEAGPKATLVRVNLSEWKVQATPDKVPPGPVAFEVTNTGAVPHALEVEGRGIEKSTPQIAAGASATLQLDLGAGRYEIYCPVGKGSHKMLGMKSHLAVESPKRAGATTRVTREAQDPVAANPAGTMDDNERGEYEHAEHEHGAHEHGEMYGNGGSDRDEDQATAKRIRITGGGTVIQVLPGPFPFADSAMAVIRNRPPDQQADLTKKAHLGPYSNNVARIAGDISLEAIDRGATGDSVSGVAEFTAQDGARWKVVMDRVQTRDIPFNPRFGGVIMGLFYHGASGVHTPLVPTIQSSLALWAFAHLYRNEQLVTDDAMVHIMLLSRTRRTSDWALDCWDCSERPIEELQLQVTPPPNTPAFESPGGVLFVNWEKSSGERRAL